MKKILILKLKALLLVYSFLIFSNSLALPLEVEGENLPSLAPMLENVTPAVVNIATEGRIKLKQNLLFSDPFFQRFFKQPQPLERKTKSLGSGVVVDAKRGLILTNHHVINNAIQITVTLNDGRYYNAEVVGADPETDVAVIKINAKNLTAIKTTISKNMRVGDFVVAIGNPFGLGQTVTSGIISALGRSGLGIEGYEDFIQTDASINPGNSGGALVNLRGELIGINTAIFSQGGGNIGIGFAIPISMALEIMEQLVKTGEVKRGFLGVNIQDLNPELAEAFGLEKQQGAIISRIIKNSPAEKAGLKAGDIILSIENKPIKNASDLKNQIGLLPVNKKIIFKILRNNKEQQVGVTVTESTSATKNNSHNIKNKLLQGLAIGDIEKDNPYYGKIDGVEVMSVDNGVIAWRSGLRAGDIITSVNKIKIKNLQQFLSLVNKKNKFLLFRIIRENTAVFLVIKE